MSGRNRTLRAVVSSTATVPANIGSVVRSCFHKTQSLLYVATTDSIICTNTISEKTVGKITLSESLGGVSHLFSCGRTGEFLCAVFGNGSVGVWDALTLANLMIFAPQNGDDTTTEHPGKICACCADAEPYVFMTNYATKSIIVFDLNKLSLFHLRGACKKGIVAMIAHPVRSLLIYVTNEGDLRCWDYVVQQNIASADDCLPPEEQCHFAFDPRAQTLVAVTSNANIYRWEITGLEEGTEARKKRRTLKRTTTRKIVGTELRFCFIGMSKLAKANTPITNCRFHPIFGKAGLKDTLFMTLSGHTVQMWDLDSMSKSTGKDKGIAAISSRVQELALACDPAAEGIRGEIVMHPKQDVFTVLPGALKDVRDKVCAVNCFSFEDLLVSSFKTGSTSFTTLPAPDLDNMVWSVDSAFKLKTGGIFYISAKTLFVYSTRTGNTQKVPRIPTELIVCDGAVPEKTEFTPTSIQCCEEQNIIAVRFTACTSSKGTFASYVACFEFSYNKKEDLFSFRFLKSFATNYAVFSTYNDKTHLFFLTKSKESVHIVPVTVLKELGPYVSKLNETKFAPFAKEEHRPYLFERMFTCPTSEGNLVLMFCREPGPPEKNIITLLDPFRVHDFNSNPTYTLQAGEFPVSVSWQHSTFIPEVLEDKDLNKVSVCAVLTNYGRIIFFSIPALKVLRIHTRSRTQRLRFASRTVGSSQMSIMRGTRKDDMIQSIFWVGWNLFYTTPKGLFGYCFRTDKSKFLLSLNGQNHAIAGVLPDRVVLMSQIGIQSTVFTRPICLLGPVVEGEVSFYTAGEQFASDGAYKSTVVNRVRQLLTRFEWTRIDDDLCEALKTVGLQSCLKTLCSHPSALVSIGNANATFAELVEIQHYRKAFDVLAVQMAEGKPCERDFELLASAFYKKGDIETARRCFELSKNYEALIVHETLFGQGQDSSLAQLPEELVAIKDKLVEISKEQNLMADFQKPDEVVCPVCTPITRAEVVYDSHDEPSSHLWVDECAHWVPPNAVPFRSNPLIAHVDSESHMPLSTLSNDFKLENIATMQGFETLPFSFEGRSENQPGFQIIPTSFVPKDILLTTTYEREAPNESSEELKSIMEADNPPILPIDLDEDTMSRSFSSTPVKLDQKAAMESPSAERSELSRVSFSIDSDERSARSSSVYSASGADLDVPPPATEDVPPPTDDVPPPMDDAPPPVDSVLPPPADSPPPPADSVPPPPMDDAPPPADSVPPPSVDDVPPPMDDDVPPPPADSVPPPADSPPPPADSVPPPPMEDDVPPPADSVPPPPMEDELPPPAAEDIPPPAMGPPIDELPPPPADEEDIPPPMLSPSVDTPPPPSFEDDVPPPVVTPPPAEPTRPSPKKGGLKLPPPPPAGKPLLEGSEASSSSAAFAPLPTRPSGKLKLPPPPAPVVMHNPLPEPPKTPTRKRREVPLVATPQKRADRPRAGSVVSAEQMTYLSEKLKTVESIVMEKWGNGDYEGCAFSLGEFLRNFGTNNTSDVVGCLGEGVLRLANLRLAALMHEHFSHPTPIEKQDRKLLAFRSMLVLTINLPHNARKNIELHAAEKNMQVCNYKTARDLVSPFVHLDLPNKFELQQMQKECNAKGNENMCPLSFFCCYCEDQVDSFDAKCPHCGNAAAFSASNPFQLLTEVSWLECDICDAKFPKSSAHAGDKCKLCMCGVVNPVVQ